MKKKILSIILLVCFTNNFLFPINAFSQQEKPIIAVIDFTAGEGVTKGQIDLITKFVEEEIFKTKRFKLVERSAMQTILKEVGFQQTGCTDTECAVEIGKMLNAEKIVVGMVSKQDKTYYINIRFINIEKAEIEDIQTAEVKNEKDFRNACKKLVKDMFLVKKEEIKKEEVAKKVEEKKEIKKPEMPVEKKEIKKVPKKKKKNTTTYILGLILAGGLAAGLGGGGKDGGTTTPPPQKHVPPMPPD